MGEPAIRKAITVLDMLSGDPETVRLAELRMKKILDEISNFFPIIYFILSVVFFHICTSCFYYGTKEKNDEILWL